MFEKDLAMVLAHTVVRRGVRGFTFDDLARVASRSRLTISFVANWLATARASGFVEAMGFDPGAEAGQSGPRRYRLAQPMAAGSRADRP